MATEMTPEEIAIERQQVEAVFGLTGGELNDGPLCFYDADAKPGTDGAMEWRRSFFYDGPPSYASADYPDLHTDEATYLTIVCDCLHGMPPERITLKDDDSRVYVRDNYFTSSGETECPCADMGGEPDPFAGKACPLCERSADDPKHGHIYLGDGWCEVVYRHDTTEHMRKTCRSLNIQVWQDKEAMCMECGDCCPSERWPDGAQNHDEGCSRVPTDVKHSEVASWWWETCSPGCLPDSEVAGPFNTEREALEDATNGLE